jgi:hypothetical protein
LRSKTWRSDAPTAILDVSCGPGDYTVASISDIARYLPQGMIFYCTDYPGGISHDTGESYTTMTVRKIREAAQQGRLLLAEAPVATDADLFTGRAPLMPRGALANIVHWSHSGYHVRDALGPGRDDPQAIAFGLNVAIGKMWAALERLGLMFCVHQTRYASDGVPSQMLPISHKYSGVLDDVPERITARIRRLGGHAVEVNFASPLKFPGLDPAGWKALEEPDRWDGLDPAQTRTLRLLNFIAYDFSDPGKAALEKIAAQGRLAAYIDEFKTITAINGGHIVVKCAFQMFSKSDEVATKLAGIADELRSGMAGYCDEMTAELGKFRNLGPIISMWNTK